MKHKWVNPPAGMGLSVWRVCAKCCRVVPIDRDIDPVAAMAVEDCNVADEEACEPDVVVALENMQAAVEQLEKTVSRLQSIVQMGFGMHEAELYSIEPWHLERLRTVATKLFAAGEGGPRPGDGIQPFWRGPEAALIQTRAKVPT